VILMDSPHKNCPIMDLIIYKRDSIMVYNII